MGGGCCSTHPGSEIEQNKKGHHLHISKFGHDHSKSKERHQIQFCKHQFQGQQSLNWSPVGPGVCLRQNTASQMPAFLQSTSSTGQISAPTPWPIPPHTPHGTCNGASCWRARRRCRTHSSGQPGGQGANGSSVKQMGPG